MGICQTGATLRIMEWASSSEVCRDSFEAACARRLLGARKFWSSVCKIWVVGSI